MPACKCRCSFFNKTKKKFVQVCKKEKSRERSHANLLPRMRGISLDVSSGNATCANMLRFCVARFEPVGEIPDVLIKLKRNSCKFARKKNQEKEVMQTCCPACGAYPWMS